MDFNPNNPIVKLCLQGMDAEAKGNIDDASHIFSKAWQEATSDLEKFLAAYYVARCQKNTADKLVWTETALQFAIQTNDEGVKAAFPTLYTSIAKCYEALNDPINAKKNYERAEAAKNAPSDKGPFYHGTRADLKIGDLLVPGGQSNYQPGLVMNHIYFTALVNGAGLAAALANGDGEEHVYIVEPTGTYENDPNVTDKKFPGNPTRSYRTTAALKIIGEVTDWVKTTPEDRQKWREKLANTNGQIIN